jgi:cobalt-zinc-cadmium efflux system membrane fusion protein
MKHSFLILLTIALISSCKNKSQNEELDVAFALSDSMFKTTTTADCKLFQLKNELTFYGKITADNSKMIEVFPLVGGNVTKVYVELGDFVNKGQLLATIRSTEVAGFEKDLEDAQNDVIVAKNNYKVTQELFDGKLNAERDVIAAKSNLDKALSQLKRVQETFRIYNIGKESIYEVKSPLSGFVIQKNINEDMLLRNDRTDNIFDIAEINKVWAIANVSESDINLVKLGEDAAVKTISYPDQILYGKVDKIFNIIDPETKAMKVRIILDNPNFMLKPEMRASINLNFIEDRKMLAVPKEAIIFDKSRSYVMVYKDRRNIETRQIEVFRQVGELAYISHGLKENEKVMTHNQLLVYDALND